MCDVDRKNRKLCFCRKFLFFFYRKKYDMCLKILFLRNNIWEVIESYLSSGEEDSGDVNGYWGMWLSLLGN